MLFGLTRIQPTNRLKMQAVTSKWSVWIVPLLMVPFLCSCNYLKQLTGSVPQPGQQAPSTGGNIPPPKAKGLPGVLTGYWKLAYTVNDEVKSCHFNVDHQGDSFSGSGTDDHNNKAFLIENGHAQNNEVVFYKRYENPDTPGQPPVAYVGSMTTQQGLAYMNGSYSVTLQGKQFTGQWEAEQEQAASTPEQQAEQAQPPSQGPADGRPPDLSGKWNAGFEHNFKTVHSTMFLEQHSVKNAKDPNIRGHGFDHNTNEKFVIEKGYYSFPAITIYRKYPEIKVKGKVVKPSRMMTFKAQVEWVSDKDYTGPYMSGKTEGGGGWEAQLVR